jgi:hypothetical protein
VTVVVLTENNGCDPLLTHPVVARVHPTLIVFARANPKPLQAAPFDDPSSITPPLRHSR